MFISRIVTMTVTVSFCVLTLIHTEVYDLCVRLARIPYVVVNLPLAIGCFWVYNWLRIGDHMDLNLNPLYNTNTGKARFNGMRTAVIWLLFSVGLWFFALAIPLLPFVLFNIRAFLIAIGYLPNTSLGGP